MVINGRIRAFIAVPLSEEVSTGLKIGQDALRETGIAASFPRVSSMHITLKFLGDITGEQAILIKEILDERISGFQSFEIEVRRIGSFPSLKNPRVIWAGLESGGSLEKLHDIVESEVSRLGFEPERREYNPHITLARIKSSRNLDQLAALLEALKDFQSGTTRVKSINLYQSTLRPEGPV